MNNMMTVVCPNCDRKHIIRKVDGMFIKNIRNPQMDNLLNFKPGEVIPFVQGYPCSPRCGSTVKWPGFETADELRFESDNFDISLRNSILYHRIIDIDRNRYLLTLDNGVMLKFEGNRGCPGCGSGMYDITDFCPTVVDNAITNIKLVETRLDDESECPKDEYGEYRYELFIYAEDKEMKLLSCVGDDGNGCYGSGFNVWVSKIIKPDGEVV